MASNTAIQRFASSLDYGIVPGAPATISRADIAQWTSRVSPEVAHHFVERYEELQRDYCALMESYELNRRVYNSEMRFEPVIGQTYYLYEKENGARFVSLVSPAHTFWSGFVCAIRLTPSYTWERVPNTKKQS